MSEYLTVQDDPKILVVDDDEATCRSLSDVLIASGYQVDQAFTASSALHHATRHMYDLIILDLQLPDSSGMDLMPEIERVSPDTEIVVVTGHASIQNAIQSVTHATVGFLLKPLDLTQLLRIVDRVTARRRAARELAHYQKNLESMVEERTRELDESRERLLVSERLASVGTLAAGIAHQINNPAGAILASAEYALLVESDPDQHDVWKASFKTIVDEANRCGKIVRSVLQFARNEPTEKWPTDLNEVVQGACRVVSTYASERGAKLEFERSSSPAFAQLSQIELEQVMVNVLRNAIESKADGARVVVVVEQDASIVTTRIRDDGDGMTEEQIRHIFDPFFTSRADLGGTGLGLSVAHGIVLDHDGIIAVDSQLGQGTTVAIELPCVDEP